MRPKKSPSKSPAQGRHRDPETPNVEQQPGSGTSEKELTTAEDKRWIEDMAILRRAAQELAERRMTAKTATPWLASDNAYYRLIDSLGRSSDEDRNQTIRVLYHNNPEKVASFLNVALREGPPERRRKIGAALMGSGLVKEAINNLTGEKDKECYSALSLLFLAARAGEIQPLVSAIESHPSVELRLKLVGLLVSSGEPEILKAFRRLAVSKSLALEVRPAIVEAISRLSTQTREAAA
jgi:hypothetical protein